MKFRKQVWEKLADEWNLNQERITYKEIELNEIQDHADLMLEEKFKGTMIVKLLK